jgi:SAM-dependent methyltransferase
VVPVEAAGTCDERGPGFLYVWKLPPNSTVLEIGDGWGASVAAMGRALARVIAVEDVVERAPFIDLRAYQMNLPVNAICADFLSLPLARKRFDAIALNRILNSLPAVAGDPWEAQLRVLRSIRESLKPFGFVCARVRNRPGWDRLRGQPRRAGENDGVYVRSLPGYRKLFHETGYGAVRAFHAWNGSMDTALLLPLSNSRALRYSVDLCGFAGFGWRGRIKQTILRAAARTGLWAHAIMAHSGGNRIWNDGSRSDYRFDYGAARRPLRHAGVSLLPERDLP